MRTIIICFCVLLTSIAFAQNPRVKDVGNFTEVKVFDRMKVNLIKSNEDKVVLSGEDVDYIEVINKDGLLKIRMDFDKIFDGNKTFVEVHYTNLHVIDGNEGAEIVSNELIEQKKIIIRTQEGAQVKAGLNVDNAEIRAVTGGIVDISGLANVQKVEVNTGGIFDGKELKTKTTELRIQAGGEADIYATELADVKIRAGGDVNIYGNPKEVIKDNFIGGRINVMR